MKKTRHFFVILTLLTVLPIFGFAQNVLFVTNMQTTDQTHRYIKTYCLDNGYSLNISTPSSPDLQDLYDSSDLVIIGPQTRNEPDTIAAFVSITGANPEKPMIISQGNYMVQYQITSRAGFNSNDGYQMTINPDQASHPLTAGKSGPILVYDFPQGIEAATGNNDKNVYVIRKPEIAASAIIIGSNTTDANRISLCAFESGSTMLDGTTKNNNRLVAFYFAVWTNVAVCEYNTNTDDLFTAAFNWALEGEAMPNSINEFEAIPYKIINNILEWEDTNITVVITSLTGQELLRASNINEKAVSLKNLESGTYLITLSKRGTVDRNTFKFLKK